jgi:hypothetical protein
LDTPRPVRGWTKKEIEMAQRVNGNPLGSAVENLERGLGRLRRQIRSQGRSLEKRLEKGRRQIEKSRREIETRGRKQVRSLLEDLRRQPVVKRAQALRKDAGRQIESGVENVLGLFQIASKREVERIDRKLRSLDKKLAGLEKAKPRATAAEQRTAASA